MLFDILLYIYELLLKDLWYYSKLLRLWIYTKYFKRDSDSKDIVDLPVAVVEDDDKEHIPWDVFFYKWAAVGFFSQAGLWCFYYHLLGSWLASRFSIDSSIVYTFSLFSELVLGLSQPWTLFLTFGLTSSNTKEGFKGFLWRFCFLLLRAIL